MREKLKGAVLVALVIFALFITNVIAIGYVVPHVKSASLQSQSAALSAGQKTRQAKVNTVQSGSNGEQENSYEDQNENENNENYQAQQQAIARQQALAQQQALAEQQALARQQAQQAYVPPQPIRRITRAS